MGTANGGSFWRTHVWNRRRQLVRDKAPWLTFLLAVAFSTFAPMLPVASMPVPELAELGLLYAALSFAAAIAGVGIAFGVPGAERVRRWSTIKSNSSEFPVFSDLAFVFTWAAMVQVGVVVVSFLAMAFGRGATIVPIGRSVMEAPWHYVCLFLAMWLWWYALFELTAVIRTVMQVTNAIVIEEAADLEQAED